MSDISKASPRLYEKYPDQPQLVPEDVPANGKVALLTGITGAC
jgi:hypothetical protein